MAHILNTEISIVFQLGYNRTVGTLYLISGLFASYSVTTQVRVANAGIMLDLCNE